MLKEGERINLRSHGDVKHQASLNNITFHGSNRKLSALNANNPNLRRMSHLGSFMRDKPIFDEHEINQINPNFKLPPLDMKKPQVEEPQQPSE